MVTLFPIEHNVVLNLLPDLANIVPSYLLPTDSNIILSQLLDQGNTVPSDLTSC